MFLVRLDRKVFLTRLCSGEMLFVIGCIAIVIAGGFVLVMVFCVIFISVFACV